MKRPTWIALLVFALTTIHAFADQTPSPNVLNGLRRPPFFGAAVRPVEGKLVVEAVDAGSAAEKAGLQRGDVIVSVDATPITDPGAYAPAFMKKKAGDTVSIVVRRGDQNLTKQATLNALPLEKQAAYDIDYSTVDVDGTKRRVILTKPRTEGKHPAVLLLGGLGCYSVDGLLRPATFTNSYANVLDAFTRAGYVTMRVQKSGMGDSEGPKCSDPSVDFEAEARGFAAGLKALDTMEGVDSDNIFLFAHSMGPLDAARIVPEHPVRGIVVAETVGTGWMEYTLTNSRRQLLLSGTPYDAVERSMRQREVCAHRFYVEKQKPDAIVAADSACAEDLQFPQPYTFMQQVGSLDLAAQWKKIDAPVLIIYGTADFITDDYQHQYLRDMINSFHPGRATYVKIDGMDHGLTIVGSQKASFEGVPDAPFAQQVVTESLRFFAAARKVS
jgi:pimeloyl-ACP methyl ester carboxylesterase